MPDSKKIIISLWLVLASCLFLSAIFWYLFAVPELTKVPDDFSYTADIQSIDNFFDLEKNTFSGEVPSQTKFSYSVKTAQQKILEIENIFDVRKPSGEPIFSVKRLYGVNPLTGEHIAGAGDKDRTGYLFAPKNLHKQDFTYWHINYDEPATMKFQAEETILGLKVYRYEAKYNADQTRNLTNLPEVGKTKGINLDIDLQLWIEPLTGRMIKYQDNTQAFYYDLATQKRTTPWNTFSNTFTQASLADQVQITQNVIEKFILVSRVIPGVLVLSAAILFVTILLNLRKKTDTNAEHVKPRMNATLSALFSFVPPLALCLSSLYFTHYVWLLTNETIHRQSQAEFDRRSSTIQSLIKNHLNEYSNLLYSTRGFMMASQHVDRNEWSDFVNELQIEKNYEGLFSMGYLEKVTDAQKQAFIGAVRADTSINPLGYPSFTIYPEATKEAYIVLKYITPVTPEREKALGLDYTVETQRNLATQKAIESGKPSATAPIISVSTKVPSFAILLPVYTKNSSLETVAQRSQAAQGIITAGFQIHALFDTILHDKSDLNDLVVEISDPQLSLGSQLLYSTNDQAIPDDSQITKEKGYVNSLPIEVAGRVWVLKFYAAKQLGISAVESNLPRLVVVIGVSFSVIVSLVMYFVLSSNRRAYQMVERATKKLKESESKYRTIFESMTDVLYQTDLQGNIITVTPSIENFLGIPAAQVIGKNATDFYADPAQREQMMTQLLSAGKVVDYQITLMTKGQQSLAVSLNAHLIYDDQKNSIGVEGLLRDVSERKKTEDGILSKNDELERVNKITIDRELRMIELKKELEACKMKCENLSLKA